MPIDINAEAFSHARERLSMPRLPIFQRRHGKSGNRADTRPAGVNRELTDVIIISMSYQLFSIRAIARHKVADAAYNQGLVQKSGLSSLLAPRQREDHIGISRSSKSTSAVKS
jgi:hypothetical protein